jgi:multimeric flavodoxin WrbA
MKVLLLSDKEYRTEVFDKIHNRLMDYLGEKGFQTEEIALGREELAFCMGCFGCWVKSPGECVIKDVMARINEKYVNSDVVVYLCPVVFGQMSANIKNAIDRWLPNVLPFFEKRKDGSTIHPTRYKHNPIQIMIAYGDSLEEEDVQLFMDISLKHRSGAHILVYRDCVEELIEELNRISLGKVGAIV